MNTIGWAFIGFLAGVLVGVGLAFLFKIVRREIADDITRDLKTVFGDISFQALSKSTTEFQKLAKAEFASERGLGVKDLENKKDLIGLELGNVSKQLEKVTELVHSFEKDREDKFGQLTSQIKNTNTQTDALLKTTNNLREALASSKTRGQWGERMAEDVLRLAGFIENVNYLKQRAIESIGSKPDITFLLPKGLKLNMDVKFPYDNYVRHLNAVTDPEKEKFKTDFFRDVKQKLKEVTARDYINPEQNTVDYVILFVPNEQIYAFIHENEPTLLDTGIRNKVVFCSPITLFAVLAIIRQAVDNFSVERASGEILSLLGQVKKQWGLFIKKMDLLGTRLDSAKQEYDALITTRKNALDKPLTNIDRIREQHGLPVSEEEKIPGVEGLIVPRPQIEQALSEDAET